MKGEPIAVTRRTLLRGGAVLGATGLSGLGLPACASSEVSAASSNIGVAGGVLGKTFDIPVEGGKIFEAEKVVVTQPEPGDFRAFSAVCTHLGCIVTDVTARTINCWCHSSLFSITDGAVEYGPARRPLPKVRIRVEGDTISLA